MTESPILFRDYSPPVGPELPPGFLVVWRECDIEDDRVRPLAIVDMETKRQIA